MASFWRITWGPLLVALLKPRDIEACRTLVLSPRNMWWFAMTQTDVLDRLPLLPAAFWVLPKPTVPSILSQSMEHSSHSNFWKAHGKDHGKWPVIYLTRCFSTFTFLTLGAGEFFAVGGCPARRRTFSSVPGLYPLGDRSTHLPLWWSNNVSRHCQMPLGSLAGVGGWGVLCLETIGLTKGERGRNI